MGAAEKIISAVKRGVTAFADQLKNPPMGEVGAASILASGVKFLLYNPDDLVRSKAKGLRIYQEMTREPYIKAGLIQKKASLLSVPWDIEAASSNPKDVQIADFCKWNLQTYLKGSFNRDLWEVLDALNCGFSVAEKIFAICQDGPYKGKVVYEKIKSKDPYFFEFEPDLYGNIENGGFLLNSPSHILEPVPLEKFFVFSWAMKYENRYGDSDLRAAYRAFWIKDTAWKLRAIYMERFSGNNLKGFYPPNDPNGKARLMEIFASWQRETGIVLPKGLDVEVLNLATSSVSEYERSIADLNAEILVGLLGETLTVDQGQKSGARALGQVHKSVADLFVLYLDLMITADVNEQIIRPLVDYNFAGVQAYPLWRFEAREDFDPFTYSQALTNLKSLGVVIPASYVYKRYRIPPPEETVKNAPPTPFSEVVSSSDNGYYRPLTKFEQFAELPKVDARLKKLEAVSIAQSRPAYEKIFASISDQVKKKDILGKKDYAAAGKIIVNPGPLKDRLFKPFFSAAIAGRADAVKAAQNQGYEFGRVRKFDDVNFDLSILDAPISPEEAVKYFSGHIPMTKEEYQQLVSELQDQAFYVAGLEKSNIEGDVKSLIMDALKNGMSYEDFEHALSELAIKYTTPVYGQVGNVGSGMLDYHTENVFRTNMMDAYNQGLSDIYSDPDVSDYFPALQYSAIMDGRTSNICRALDGKIYMQSDPVWKKITPPNHYECRSTVVPINKYDFSRDMLSDPPSVTPQKGFGG